jgi:hypothetical protein
MQASTSNRCSRPACGGPARGLPPRALRLARVVRSRSSGNAEVQQTAQRPQMKRDPFVDAVWRLQSLLHAVG